MCLNVPDNTSQQQSPARVVQDTDVHGLNMSPDPFGFCSRGRIQYRVRPTLTQGPVGAPMRAPSDWFDSKDSS
ncbi:hypothetical protein PI124_g8480 [Phytophthora idaei]|nr:hypothetical protein PI125_g8866 [Phytophthora idaei]KAG3151440.1 hypothetical protein PI126_g11002 [Phytophthora idaei]KAG3246821.1 hypothetical protein PI124_g8480 [Phytophthora idaei]